MASRDFPVELVPGLGSVVPEDCLDDPAALRHALRDGVISLASFMDRCGGAASCTATGNLHEGDYVGDEAILEMPTEDVVKYRCGPDELPERVVRAAILHTFVNWEEKYVIDDLTGEVLPPDLVKFAKRDELSEMYRRSVWTEVPVSESIEKTGKPPIPVRWVIANKGEKLQREGKACRQASRLEVWR